MAKFLEAISAVISSTDVVQMKLQELKLMKQDFISLSKQLVKKSRGYANEKDRSVVYVQLLLSEFIVMMNAITASVSYSSIMTYGAWLRPSNSNKFWRGADLMERSCKFIITYILYWTHWIV